MFVARQSRSWSSRRSPALRPILETLEDRVLPSGPSLIADTTQYPASAVVRTITTWPDGRTDYGTGTMVNPNTVLTSGAVVYSYNDGGYAKSIAVIAGQNGSSIPFGVAFASQTGGTLNVFAFNSFQQYGLTAGDGNIGFISLDRDLGELTNWQDVVAPTQYSLTVGKLGYPISQGYYDGIHMYSDSGPANAYQGQFQGFAYWEWPASSMLTYYGESGSTLGILQSNGRPAILGVANLYDSSGNGYGDVITSAVTQALTAFEQAHPPTGQSGSLVQLGSSPTVPFGHNFGLTIAAEDGFGNVLQTYNGPMTLRIQSGPGGGSLSGPYVVNAVNGVANFSNLNLSMPGAYTLLATANGMTSATTETITVSAPNLNVPPLLALLDSLLKGVETFNANGTETITDSIFGISLFVATFDSSGNLESVTMLGFNVTFLFG